MFFAADLISSISFSGTSSYAELISSADTRRLPLMQSSNFLLYPASVTSPFSLTSFIIFFTSASSVSALASVLGFALFMIFIFFLVKSAPLLREAGLFHLFISLRSILLILLRFVRCCPYMLS